MISEPNPCMLYKHAEVADEYSRKQSQNAWASLRQIAIDSYDASEFENVLYALECKYMEEMYEHVSEAKWPKTGKWKFAKFKYRDEDGNETIGGLPASYRSAKSVLLNGMKSGVKIDASTGKSKVDEHLRSAKKSDKQRAIEHLQKSIDLVSKHSNPDDCWSSVTRSVKWRWME